MTTYGSKRVRGLSDEARWTITAHGIAAHDYVLHYERAGTTWTGDKCGALTPAASATTTRWASRARVCLS